MYAKYLSEDFLPIVNVYVKYEDKKGCHHLRNQGMRVSQKEDTNIILFFLLQDSPLFQFWAI